MNPRLPLAFLALSATLCMAAEKWKIQYYLDEDQVTFDIRDLRFPSTRRGIAVGAIVDGKTGKIKPHSVITSDGGKTWTAVAIREPAHALFFLDESRGWMVTDKGIWRTEESGHSWVKLASSPKDVLRVYFLDPQHGFAVGAKRSVHQTKDGGKTWSRIAAADATNTSLEYTVYDWIEFASPKVGLIAGYSRVPRRDEQKQRLPDWVDPSHASLRREVPGVAILLTTTDGGANWTSSRASVFGQITRVRMPSPRKGLGLVEFHRSFEYPSEVFQLDGRTGRNERVFRQPNRAITDILIPADTAYIAGTEVAGTLRNNPVPRKLKILKSTDWQTWTEMDIDYKANARRVTLAAADADNVWAATDTGMILKLQK